MCPDCGQLGGWRLGDGRLRCAACRSCTSVTVGTIFDRTRTPLTAWLTACWLFATQKDGVSAQSVQRELEISSYQTAWAVLHRLRSVLVRPGRERLTGTVEVDETFIGGEEPGLRGGRAKGKESLVGVAVEVKEPTGLGRCRMAILVDASAASLHPFVTAHVEPGATVITDAWQGYSGINELGYTRARRSQRAARSRGDDPFGLLPGVHRVASLAKRWLLGTHQGSVDEAETVTVTRLGVTGSLLETVMRTNPVESMIEIVRAHARNVKHWHDGDMRLRWAAAGMLGASSQFRRVKGYRQLPKLAAALRHAVGAGDPSTLAVTA